MVAVKPNKPEEVANTVLIEVRSIWSTEDGHRGK
jgi:hypothetical protein